MSEVDDATKPVEAQPEQVANETIDNADQSVDDIDATEPQAEVTAGDDKAELREDKAEDEAEEETEEKTEEKQSSGNSGNILKTTAAHDRSNPKNNNKFDPSSLEVTDDAAAIRKQVEFYFGDWNFPQDKFMWEQSEGAENKPIAVSKLHSFKRMRRFQPYTAVIAAIRDSSFLDVVGEEGKEEVKRKVAYKPMAASKAKNEAATIYAKGFGDETKSTQFDLEKFFSEFAEVKGLKLRRTNEGLFKGSVFVTFADEQTARNFINKDPAPKWDDHDLKILTKKDYCEEKNVLIREGKMTPNATAPKKFYEGKDSTRQSRGRDQRGGNRDSDDWKKRRDHDQKNGFRDGRGGGRGRGGRGRGGRGGRGGHGDRRENGNRHNDNDAKPRIQSTATEPTGESEVSNNAKRGRDDDGAGDEAPAAKKVDVKEASS